jgi:4-hydroxy-tetrahydrodipicolinate synthase
VPPFYFRYTDEALFRHFQTVAASAPDFPIYLYDNPAVSGNSLSTKLAYRLVEACPNIVGLKDSSGSLDTLNAATSWRNGTFNTASGPDGMILAATAIGVDACVSGTANFVPELVVALKTAAMQGETDKARALQTQLNEVRRIVRDGADLSLFKGILARRGLPVGSVRAPLLQASADVVSTCWQQLEALGVELAFI